MSILKVLTDLCAMRQKNLKKTTFPHIVYNF